MGTQKSALETYETRNCTADLGSSQNLPNLGPGIRGHIRN